MSAPELLRIREPLERPLPGLDWRERHARLRAWLASHARVLVAYSGGVDSSVLLRVAHDVLGSRTRGVIGRSDSYSSRELALALEQAAGMGVAVDVVPTGELSDPAFARNDADRCYHCKRELYRRLDEVAAREQGTVIVDGTIADDLADWRPGRRAAEERAVRSPLAELGFAKADVRALAAHLGLPSQAKPASPCLASRVPYGTPITEAILAQVERAEASLRALGFAELRVRHHGEVGRIEVPAAQLARLLERSIRESAVAALREAGYRYVALDLEGFRSGGLNRSLEAAEVRNGLSPRPLAPGGEARDISGTASEGPR